jgi:PAS domain S-box-containing protein
MSAGLIALIAGPVILIPLACYALAHRRVRGATWYAALLLTIAFWSVTYAWELLLPDLESKALALKIKYLGVVLVPSGWIGFILSFVGFEPRRVWTRVLPVALVSSVMLALAWTDGLHGLFWGPLSLYPADDYSVIRGRGPLFWVNIGYTYCVLAAGIIVLALNAIQSPYLYRSSARILMLGVVVPWLGNLFFVTQAGDTTVDFTPFLFSCTALIAALAVFRFELLEPAPTLSEARIENVSDAIIILDRRQRIADVNTAAAVFLGCSRGEAGGRQIETVVPEWPAGALDGQGTDITRETGGMPARTYDVRATDVRSRAGELTGRVLVLRDVTAQRRAERALRDSELLYRTVIELASDGLWVADAAGTIVDVNPGACAMLGYTRAELVHRAVRDLVERQDVDGVPLGDDRSASNAIDWHGQVTTAAGRTLLLAGRSVPITPDIVVSTFRDITEERAQAEQRERLLLEAQAAIRLKDEFLATLSHELRTPIAAVLGWVRLLSRREVEPERVVHALDVIERNAQAQARLVDDLLDVSRMARGGLHLALAETELATVLSEALDAIGPSAQVKGIAIEIALPPSLQDVWADPGRIQQVLWNLLTNAIKFTPSGGTVTVSCVNRPDAVELVVRDTGQGIDPAFLPFVFEPFRQGDGGKSRGIAGLGLGLAIVRRIVEAHGGRVEAASDGVGLGTTFRLHLPTTTSPIRRRRAADQQAAAEGDATVAHERG